MMDTIMSKLREIRYKAVSFFSRYDAYLVPVCKFILAMFVFCIINSGFGYMTKIAKFPIALILGLFCSFMPMNMIVVLGALLTLLHAYALSTECAIVLAVVYVIMFLLYFRFSPKDTIAVLLTPICFVLKIPYIIPMSFGLVGTPGSAVSVACGAVVFYVLRYLGKAGEAIREAEESDLVANLKAILDGLLANREMMVCAAAFAITVLLVYVIRRLEIDHAWTIAMVVGALSDILIILVGDIMYKTGISVIGLLFGTLLGCVAVKIIQFFVFDIDYKKTEKVQFEDEDYYYFVKAVPKIKTLEEKENKKEIRRSERRNDEEERNEEPVRQRRTRPSEENAGSESGGRVRASAEERVAARRRLEEAGARNEAGSEENEIRTGSARTTDEIRRARAASQNESQLRQRRPQMTEEERQAEMARRREIIRRREERAAQMAAMNNSNPNGQIVQTEDDDLGLSRRLAYQKRRMEERNENNQE